MTGTRIAPYEIVGKLGEGGMGEVYRAHDARLGRDVAIKVLPTVLNADPDPSSGSGSPRAQSRGERVARFEREARTLAVLNHPHIAQIFGVEDHGTTRAIVMELVEGPDDRSYVGIGWVARQETRAAAVSSPERA